jgi:membrane protease YdiL (CAAX protease family)
MAPESARPSSFGDRAAPIAPMSSAAAAGWTFLVTFVFLALAGVMYALRGETRGDLVTGFSCQVISYTLGLFLILRVYAPERSIRDFIALRPTAWAFYPLAILLGIAIAFPAGALYDVVCARYPSVDQDAMTEVFRASSPARRVVMGFVLAAAGPAVEEVLFRGALMRPLRRRYSAGLSAVLTAILFALVHLEWQMFPPIVIVGLCLGLVRNWSGSLVVSTLLHGAFNAVSLGDLVREAAGAPAMKTPLAATIGGAVVSVAVLAVMRVVSQRAPAALAAREADG